MQKRDSFDLKRPNFSPVEFALKVGTGYPLQEDLIKIIENSNPPWRSGKTKNGVRWSNFLTWLNFQRLEAFFLRQYGVTRERQPCLPDRSATYYSSDVQFAGYLYRKLQFVNKDELNLFTQRAINIRHLELLAVCWKIFKNTGGNRPEKIQEIITSLNAEKFDYALTLMDRVNHDQHILDKPFKNLMLDFTMDCLGCREFLIRELCKDLNNSDQELLHALFMAFLRKDPISLHFCILEIYAWADENVSATQLLRHLTKIIKIMIREETDTGKKKKGSFKKTYILLDELINKKNGPVNRLALVEKKIASFESLWCDSSEGVLREKNPETLQCFAVQPSYELCQSVIHKLHVIMKNSTSGPPSEVNLKKNDAYRELVTLIDKVKDATPLKLLSDILDEYRNGLTKIEKMWNPRREAFRFYIHFSIFAIEDLTIKDYLYDLCFTHNLKVNWIVQHLTWDIELLDLSVVSRNDFLPEEIQSLKALYQLKKRHPGNFTFLLPIQSNFSDMSFVFTQHESYIKYQYSDVPSTSAIRQTRQLKMQVNPDALSYDYD